MRRGGWGRDFFLVTGWLLGFEKEVVRGSLVRGGVVVAVVDVFARVWGPWGSAVKTRGRILQSC